ncbi:Lrp/AsnC family transcriptional regulator [Pseudomonas aeruginosa]|uniref:Lrp/AsnC family transcriptional regulator n=1 Tax=Pseudomonas aeruginosa TaxID=287 RepID=UPI002235ACCD|nr:Lrp/AsnC ligand binding domain-containing protein [Pseudomonas aeruginosa]
MNSKNTGPSSGSEKIGLTLTAYLNVRLEKHSDSHKRNPMDVFRASVQKWPEVVECHALTGDMDYLLRVVVRNMAHYSRFVLDTLLKHPSVQDCKTSFVLDRVKSTTALPYEHSADWCSGVQIALDLPTVARTRLQTPQPERSFPCNSISKT